jgi:hypothetical protein
MSSTLCEQTTSASTATCGIPRRDSTDSRGTPASLEADVCLRTNGRFVRLRGIELEGDDVVKLAEDGRALTLELQLPSQRNPTGGRPRMLVDTDRIAVEPVGAEVVVEVVRFGTAPSPVFLGPELTPAGEAPVSFRRDAPELVVERMDTLLPIVNQRSVLARPGLCVGTVAPVGSEVEIDAETERRLRELGYAE